MQALLGASGTMIGAALETVGFYYQSFALDALTQPLKSSAGALVYTVGVVAAMFEYVSTGKYSLGKWFLLGPALFFAVIENRTPTMGADWRYGNQPRNVQLAHEQSEDMLRQTLRQVNLNTGGGGQQQLTPAYVSSVFAWYDDLISSIVQEAVRVLSAAARAPDRDVGFLARTHLFKELYNYQVDDQGFGELIHIAYLRDCRTVVETGRQMKEPGIAQAKYDELEAKFLAAIENTKVKIRTDSAAEYVAGMMVNYPNIWDDDITGGQRPTEAWLDDLRARNQALTGAGFDPVQWKADRDENRRIVKDIEFTCPEIWNLVFLGLHRYAERKLSEVREKAVGQGLVEDQILADLAVAAGQSVDLVERNQFTPQQRVERLNFLTRAIARFIMKNESEKTSVAAFIENYATTGGGTHAVMVPTRNDLSKLESIRIKTKEWEQRTRILTTASKMPYYQGLGLYFLALIFPFFALLLLIPGKHAGFLMWFMMWLWLKSWDIGYAVVMMLDDIFFNLFALQNDGGSNIDPTKILDPDAGIAYRSLQELDPTFQPAMYYTVIAVALQSVPVISSYLVLGTVKGGSGLIARGIEATSSHFANAAQGTQQQFAITSLRSRAWDSMMARSDQYVANAKAGNSRYAGANGGIATNPLSSAPALTPQGIGRGGMTGGMTGSFDTIGDIAAAVEGTAKGLTERTKAFDSLKHMMSNRARDLQYEGAARDDKASRMRSMRNDPSRASMPARERNAEVREAANMSRDARARSMVRLRGNGVDNNEIRRRLGPSPTRLRGGAPSAGGMSRVGSVVNTIDRVATDVARVVKPLATATKDGVNTLRAAHYDTEVAHARFDTANSAAYQAIAWEARLYGMFEIPWFEKTPYEQDFQLRLTEIEVMKDMAIAAVSSGLQLWDVASSNRTRAAEEREGVDLSKYAKEGQMSQLNGLPSAGEFAKGVGTSVVGAVGGIVMSQVMGALLNKLFDMFNLGELVRDGVDALESILDDAIGTSDTAKTYLGR